MGERGGDRHSRGALGHRHTDGGRGRKVGRDFSVHCSRFTIRRSRLWFAIHVALS